jgi:hypothetical protein
MQCYQYLAAITAVANALESIPGTHRKLPHSAIADWMDVNDIEAENLLYTSREQVVAIIEPLLQQDQPGIQHAA